MDRIPLRMLSGVLLSGVVAVAAQAEVKLPVPAVDQSAVAKRGYFYVGGKGNTSNTVTITAPGCP